MPNAAQKVRALLDNTNTPYGRSGQGYKKGLGDDPQDRAAKDIIGQIKSHLTACPTCGNVTRKQKGGR